MPKDLLTKSDYQHLFDFSQRIVFSKNDYVNDCLRNISHYFGFHLCACSIFKKPKKDHMINLYTMKSPFFENYFLEKCMIAAEQDQKLYPEWQLFRNQNSWQGVLFSEDIPDFKKSNFYRVFHERKIDFAAYMSVQRQPEITFYILKSSLEKEFTARERQLIMQINLVLQRTFRLYMGQQFQAEKGKVTKSILNNHEFGFLMTDINLDYLSCNDKFFYLLESFYKTENLKKNLQKLVQDISGQEEMSNIEEGTYTIHKALIVKVKHSLISGDNDLGKEYLAIEIKKTSPEERAFLPLTHREKEIWQYIAMGYSNNEIARQLNISEVTVKVHISHLFAKLQVTNRTEAAAMKEKNTRI